MACPQELILAKGYERTSRRGGGTAGTGGRAGASAATTRARSEGAGTDCGKGAAAIGRTDGAE